MTFSREFLDVLGEWKRGWREDQTRREPIAQRLKAEAEKLSERFRTVDSPCYRKRYLMYGDLTSLLKGDLHDGITSWTVDNAFAEEFKGLYRPEAITATIFEHNPDRSEVILNIHALWQASEFKEAVEQYRAEPKLKLSQVSGPSSLKSCWMLACGSRRLSPLPDAAVPSMSYALQPA
jgi:hypothetical protein